MMQRHFQLIPLRCHCERADCSCRGVGIVDTTSGLAIERAIEQPTPSSSSSPVTRYYLVHLASGKRLLAEGVPTLVQAGRWLQRVRPLADWRAAQEALSGNEALDRQVRAAWSETIQQWERWLPELSEEWSDTGASK